MLEIVIGVVAGLFVLALGVRYIGDWLEMRRLRNERRGWR